MNFEYMLNFENKVNAGSFAILSQQKDDYQNVDDSEYTEWATEQSYVDYFSSSFHFQNNSITPDLSKAKTASYTKSNIYQLLDVLDYFEIATDYNELAKYIIRNTIPSKVLSLYVTAIMKIFNNPVIQLRLVHEEDDMHTLYMNILLKINAEQARIKFNELIEDFLIKRNGVADKVSVSYSIIK